MASLGAEKLTAVVNNLAGRDAIRQRRRSVAFDSLVTQSFAKMGQFIILHFDRIACVYLSRLGEIS